MGRFIKPVGIAVVLIGIGVAAGILYAGLAEDNVQRQAPEISDAQVVTNFEECVAAGNPVMESHPERCMVHGETFVNDTQAMIAYSELIASGRGGFQIRFPEDWGEVLKVLDSDWFLIPGQQQPSGSLTINEIASFGSDGSTVFSALVHDSFADPKGEAEPYTLVNAKAHPVEGQKYTLIYEADQTVGIGVQRFKGDRDYEYRFPLADGKELRVWYSVYGSDLRNNVATVEAIIDSIVLNESLLQ